MEAHEVHFYTKDGCECEVDCYGFLEEASNIEVVCEDEEDDFIWTDGNPDTNFPFTSWGQAVRVLSRYYDIVEMRAI